MGGFFFFFFFLEGGGGGGAAEKAADRELWRQLWLAPIFSPRFADFRSFCASQTNLKVGFSK